MLIKSLPPNHEKLAFNYAMLHQEYFSQLKPEYFEEEDLRSVYRLVVDFRNKYSEVPTAEQMVIIIKQKELENRHPENLVRMMFQYDMSPYEEQYLKETMEFWIESRSFEQSFYDVAEYVGNTKVDASNIAEVKRNARMLLLTGMDVSFDFDEGIDFFEVSSHQKIAGQTYTTGYPWIDSAMGGGFEAGTLTVFGGAPNVGKSIFLANMAASAVDLGYNTVYVTCEMRDYKVVRRLGSRLLKINMNEYPETAQNTKAMTDKLRAFQRGMRTSGLMRIPGQLIVKEYPTSTLTVPDLEVYLKHVEERRKLKFKVVVVDYMNIMRPWEKISSENTNGRIQAIAEGLRAMGQRNEWSVMTATQLNRQGWNVTDAGMDSTSDSMGVPKTADTYFGIMQTDAMKIESYYDVIAFKTRDSGDKSTRKRFDIDYKYMYLKESKINVAQ